MASMVEMGECMARLRGIGVEADFTLFRPYDGKWGFDKMDMETNKRFLRYIIARFHLVYPGQRKQLYEALIG